MAAAVSNRRYIMPGSILVDTIHAAKGLEAPAVVVYAGFLADRVKDAKTNPEEERRVGYVAVTRTSNHLSIVEPLTGPWNPVFETVRGIWK
ncbi:MAG: DNA-dependent helicase II [Firmicutes bacterium ADurb.Bin456]|nr:MAG: DNA-dependent helicase II [Firmicutes bacterium ADurb.Bin456]